MSKASLHSRKGKLNGPAQSMYGRTAPTKTRRGREDHFGTSASLLPSFNCRR